MSTTTTNYGLIKPELTDPADITDMNPNWDKIDKELKDKSEEVSTLKSDLTEHTHTAEDVGARPNTWTPTAEQVGAVSSADLLEIDLNTITYPTQGFARACTNRPLDANGYFECITTDNKAGIYQKYTYPNTNTTYVRFLIGDSWSEWSTRFLPLAGGTLSGANLGFYNGYGRISVTNKLAQMESFNVADDSINRRMLRVSNSGNQVLKDSAVLVDVISGTTKTYKLYGEHNKPSGGYVGNGSATVRNINTGGIGSTLRISSSNGDGLIGARGGVFWKDGKIISLSESEVKFSQGVLTVASTNVYLNFNSDNYYYSNV